MAGSKCTETGPGNQSVVGNVLPTMRNILSLAALAAVLLTQAATAQSTAPKVVVNTRGGLALAGYDPVSYFTGTPAKGEPDVTATYQGATYRFVSTANRDQFTRDPAKFAPQFGGYCGYGASMGYLASVDPEAYTIMNGRLILQNSKRVLELWQKEPDTRLRKADDNWPKIVEKEGKPLPR